MAPSPQEHVPAEPIPAPPSPAGNAVVISGMSGTFPDSETTKDFFDLLYNKKNPITADRPRWKYSHPELQTQLGKVPDLRSFDAQFFKVHYRQANNMDAMSRKLLEQSYQAIYDAGLSPTHLSGKKVGVYIGSCFSETEKSCFYVATTKTGFGISGCSKAMFANRISYWLNAKGPSMSIDAACSSSAVALERAYEAITRGECDAAIVGGANINLHPQSSVHYGRVIKICMDGKTKAFDKNADGCARSDAINILFLQKAKDAKRIYAEVCHVKSFFAPKLDQQNKQIYGPFRNEDNLVEFINEFYKEAAIPPSIVEYVEAFGCAVPEADKTELEVISKVFCKERGAQPLLVGSVMSNVGYGEAASGITAITKVLLGYQTGKLAANLHCEHPRDDVSTIREGQLKIVTDHEPFRRTYTAVNSLAITGVNVHVLLNGHYKPKDLSRYKSNIPHLVLVSGRQESAVEKVFKDLKTRSVDPEELALFNNIHEVKTIGHLGRGYVILDTNAENQTVSLAQKTDYCDDMKRPLWFVYSGMGSQWAGMGTQLMRIPIFAAAIERCRVALEPKGVDIVDIITNPDKSTFDNILHSFVGIAAVQIGLTDVLREMGIVPDMIIGHSVGELGCAYADGCFTAEEMILSAYSRGLVSVQTPFIRGSMAAIGLGYQQMIPMCPPEIEIACHNSADSCTISGPADVMKEFVAKLTAQGIFAKEVPCSNIAYHSRYIKEAGPGLLKYLKEVITTPKARSERWVSTSVPKEKWGEDSAKFSSAEYHTNNLLSPVLFEETSRLIPPNAVAIEIAPHGLLQAILKRSLPASCINIPLTRRGHADNAVFLLEAIGKLYITGFNPAIKVLYPKVEFPVSTGTPMLSHFVEWAHHEKWPLPLYVAARRKLAACSKLTVSPDDDDNRYLKGYVIDEKNMYPYSGILVYVWDTMAMSMGEEQKDISIEFRDVAFHNPAILQEKRLLKLTVQLNKGNGFFEVRNGTTMVMSGYALAPTKDLLLSNTAKESIEIVDVNLTSRDVYKILYSRGHDYRGDFRSILSTNASVSHAQVTWSHNWVTFLDSLIQLNILRRNSIGISKPIHIERLQININDHKLLIENCAQNNLNFVGASVDLEQNITRCGGVTLIHPEFEDQVPTMTESLNMKVTEFVPHFQLNNVQVTEALNVFLQIVAENINKEEINVIEILSFENNTSLRHEVESLFNDIPEIKLNFEQINVDNIVMDQVMNIQKADLVITKELSTSNNICELLFRVARQGIFVLTKESANTGLPTTLSRPVASIATNRGRLVLAVWRPAPAPAGSAAISVSDASDLPMLRSTKESLRADQSLLVLARYPPPFGLEEIVKKWRKEGNVIRVAMINPKKARDVVLDQLPDFDLAFNVYKNGAWGGDYFVNSKKSFGDCQSVALKSQEVGVIDSLYWEEIAEPTAEDIAVEVHYAGLNVKDAKRAMGTAPITEDDVNFGYGMDYSGVTSNGERVMGVVASGAAATVVRAERDLLWPVPAHWTLEDAATVPLPYAHAFYLLGIKYPLHTGMSILVHGGTGGLGQAAIHVALSYNCKVFATVSDVKKKRFLKKLFPEIPEEHIGNSRDETFADMVLSHTNGEGCNYVINCLAESALKNASIRCISTQGIMLDVHQLTSREPFNFGMYCLGALKSYYKVDLSSIFGTQNHDEMKELQLLISDGIAKGSVRPLSRITYDWSEAPRALRLLAGSKHRGRTLLRMKNGTPLYIPRLTTSASSSHIVLATSEDNTLALRFVDTLVARGAKNVVVNTEHHKTDGYVQMKSRSWQNLGVNVRLTSKDLTSSDDVERLIFESEKAGPVEGVYVVNAGDYDSRKSFDLIPVLNNLDSITRKLCTEIRYFAVINETGDLGRDVCVGRYDDDLPATLVLLSNLDKFPESTEASNESIKLKQSAALDVIERALRSSEPVVWACSQPQSPRNTLQLIASVGCISITDDTPGTMTLRKLGLTEEKLAAMAAYLGQSVDLCVTKDEVADITVERLRESVNQGNRNVKTKKEEGLYNLYKYVEPDELTASTELFFMSTLINTNDIREDEFIMDENYAILIPGLEGSYKIFQNFCENLKITALVLQPGYEAVNETLIEMADRLAKTITQKKLTSDGRFVLIGYSHGALVALEIARILEQQGLEGKVFCIDGEPDTYPKRLEKWIGASGDELENSLILHLYSLMVGDHSDSLANELKGINSFKEKIEACVREVRGKVAYSSQYTRVVIETAYARIQQVFNYDTARLIKDPIKSQIIYIRSEDSADSAVSNYSQKPAKVFELKSQHSNILDNLDSSNIVNINLDEFILDKFQKRNICESYLVNATTFMGNNDVFDE